MTILMHGQAVRIPWLMRAWLAMAVGIGRMVVKDLAWSLKFPKTPVVAMGDPWLAVQFLCSLSRDSVS